MWRIEVGILEHMKTLFDLLKNKEEAIKELTKHPRHKLLDVALERINYDRRDTKYKPMSMKVLGIKTAHLSIDDLGYLVKSAQQKSNFSRLFFGLLKVKKTGDKPLTIDGQ